MKRLWISVLILIVCHNVFAADPNNSTWQKANQFFNSKQYDSAIIYYETLAARKLSNPELYYNLGNAYYKANKVGPAVLNFERALQINPDYKEAQDNLSLTQARISNRIQEPQDIFFVIWWKSLTKQSLAVTWSIISLVLFLLTLAILLLKKWNRSSTWFHPQIPLLTSILFFVSLMLAFISSQKQARQDEAVVMSADTPFRQDTKSTKTQSLVPEGTVVQLQREQANWTEVKLPDGRLGWIQKDALEKI